MQKKWTVATAVLLAICLIIGLCYGVPINGEAVDGSPDNRPVVIVDAGHGGFDGGAVALDGTLEKEINLKIALKLGEWLRLVGYDVIYTRESDTGIEDSETDSIRQRKKSDMYNRLDYMSRYPEALFISIHLNKFTTSTASGTQVFYAPGNEQAKKLGQCIQESVVSLQQPDNTRVIKQGTKSTFLLYRASVPAVIVECGFLSNQRELALLKDENYQACMAYAVFCGIMSYYAQNR